MHGLEDQAAVLALNVDDALGAQDVLPLRAQQQVQPLGELRAVDGAIQRQRYPLDVVLVRMAAGAVVMAVVMVIVPVVVAMLVNVAAAGTDPPITLLLIVLLVIVNPD